MLFTVCTIEKKVIVENDKLVIAPVIGINATSDHRFMDGARAEKCMTISRDVILNPQKYSSIYTK